jgi:hypothetical protein
MENTTAGRRPSDLELKNILLLRIIVVNTTYQTGLL